MLTQDELKLHVEYNPVTGIFIRLICRTKPYLIGQPCTSTDAQGYIRIAINGERYKAHRLAFLYMTGTWPEKEVDHINRDKTDNSWDNLRDATKSENMRNQHRADDATHGVYYVCNSRKTSDGYVVKLRVDGTQKYFGYRSTLEDAVALAKEVKGKLGLVAV
jgi:hypothetical protein